MTERETEKTDQPGEDDWKQIGNEMDNVVDLVRERQKRRPPLDEEF